MTWTRRVGGALLSMLAVLLLGSSSAWAAPSPVPAPSGVPVAPSAWDCTVSASDPPVESCAVTAWQELPTLVVPPDSPTVVTVTGAGSCAAPAPSPSASSSASPSPSDDASCTQAVVATIDPVQWIVMGLFAAVALVLFLIGFVRREAVGLTT